MNIHTAYVLSNSRRRLPISCFVALMLFTNACASQAATNDAQYWIWAGILPQEAPNNAEILIYQGNFIDTEDGVGFEHKGIYPSPLTHRRVHLVYRLHRLMSPSFIADTINGNIYRWQQLGVNIQGVQLDFDSPSAKLKQYATFLHAVRERLLANIGFSITGLGTWLADASADTLQLLHAQVDYIIYQLYRGRQSTPYSRRYISFLQKNPYPFRVGVLFAKSKPLVLASLANNPKFLGTTYFIQH